MIVNMVIAASIPHETPSEDWRPKNIFMLIGAASVEVSVLTMTTSIQEKVKTKNAATPIPEDIRGKKIL